MQHHRYVHKSVKLLVSSSVISLPVCSLKRSIAPIVGLQGYASPLILISILAITDTGVYAFSVIASSSSVVGSPLFSSCMLYVLSSCAGSVRSRLVITKLPSR